MDRARAPGRRLPAGNQGHIRPDSRALSASWRTTGATGTVGKGYSGVALHVQQGLRARTSALSPSRLRSTRHRIVAVDDRRRHRRVDLRAERRQGLPGQDAVSRGDGGLRAARSPTPARTLVLCGDLNVARTDRDVHPKERKPRAIGQLPGGAGAARAHHRERPRRRRPRARSRQRRPVHLVGALAQHAAAQHRLAPRLRAGELRASRSAPCHARCRRKSARATTRRWWRRLPMARANARAYGSRWPELKLGPTVSDAA